MAAPEAAWQDPKEALANGGAEGGGGAGQEPLQLRLVQAGWFKRFPRQFG